MSFITSLAGKAVGVFGPSKYLWLAVAGMGTLVLGEGWALKHEIEKVGASSIALKDAQNALDALRARQTQDTKAVVATKAKKRLAARKSAVVSKQLDSAVAKSPQWRDTPIPQEVIDAILQHQGASLAGQASIPSDVVKPPTVDYGVQYNPDSQRSEGEGS